MAVPFKDIVLSRINVFESTPEGRVVAFRRSAGPGDAPVEIERSYGAKDAPLSFDELASSLADDGFFIFARGDRKWAINKASLASHHLIRGVYPGSEPTEMEYYGADILYDAVTGQRGEEWKIYGPGPKRDLFTTFEFENGQEFTLPAVLTFEEFTQLGIPPTLHEDITVTQLRVLYGDKPPPPRMMICAVPVDAPWPFGPRPMVDMEDVRLVSVAPHRPPRVLLRGFRAAEGFFGKHYYQAVP